MTTRKQSSSVCSPVMTVRENAAKRASISGYYVGAKARPAEKRGSVGGFTSVSSNASVLSEPLSEYSSSPVTSRARGSASGLTSGYASTSDSLFSSIEDLTASQDSLDHLCVDNLEDDEKVNDVLLRLLKDVEKLKKKVKYFKTNYDHLENQNQALARQNNYLQGQIMKHQCDNDRLMKENRRLKDKLWNLQHERQDQVQSESLPSCAIVSEEYVYV